MNKDSYRKCIRRAFIWPCRAGFGIILDFIWAKISWGIQLFWKSLLPFGKCDSNTGLLPDWPEQWPLSSLGPRMLSKATARHFFLGFLRLVCLWSGAVESLCFIPQLCPECSAGAVGSSVFPLLSTSVFISDQMSQVHRYEDKRFDSYSVGMRVMELQGKKSDWDRNQDGWPACSSSRWPSESILSICVTYLRWCECGVQ